MHLHTTTGVTAAGITPPGGSSASGGGLAAASSMAADGSPGAQYPPMAQRRATLSPIIGITGTAAPGSPASGVPPLSPAGAAGSPGSLGRMIGGPTHSPGGAGGSSGGGVFSTPRTGITGQGGLASRGSLAGGSAGGAAGGGGGAAGSPSGGSRPTSRNLNKEVPTPPRKVAAIENIGDALAKFFQESMELAPKPPPRPPSSSSSEGGEDDPLSSDDEGAQEEMDVLEKLLLVMPNLESPGKGALQGFRGMASGAPSSIQAPSRLGGSFTAGMGGGIASTSRPASPSAVRPLPGTGTGTGSLTRMNRSPSPTFGSFPGPVDPAAVAAALPMKRKSIPVSLGKGSGRTGSASSSQQLPAFLPSTAVLQFHQRALGISIALKNSGGAVTGFAAAGPYGSLSQGPDAPVTSAYVNRDADYLMVRQMVEAALVAGQNRLTPAMSGGASPMGALTGLGRGLPLATPPSASPSKKGKAGGKAASGKKGAPKKPKTPPPPPQLVPRPAVPIHLQHLVRPGTASVGALLGRHQPAGIDPAIINAVLAGQAVDPVVGFGNNAGTPGGTPSTGGLGSASALGSPVRALSPVRPASPTRPPSALPPSPTRRGPASATAGARPGSPLRPGGRTSVAASGGGAPSSAGGRGTGDDATAGGGRSSRSNNGSPTNRGSGGGAGVTLPSARPMSGSGGGGNGGAAFGRHLSMGRNSGSRPATAPGNWAAARLERLRGVAATKAAARASMSPLRASLAAPISGMRSRRVSKPLSDAEYNVLHRTMDAALMPLTRAAAKLGTYGEALPPPNLFTNLAPTVLPKTAFGAAAPLAVSAVAAAAFGAADGAASGDLASASAGEMDSQRIASLGQRPAAVVAAAALSGSTPAAAAAAPPPVSTVNIASSVSFSDRAAAIGAAAAAASTAASSGTFSGGVPAGCSGVGGVGGDDNGPRRKLRRRNFGDWEWPPGKGTLPPYDVLMETRHAVAAVLAGTEVDETGRIGPCDRVGEVGRLMRRFQKQDTRAMFNLSHAVNGIDQIVALVDVLAHPDLAAVSELLLGGNALNDEAFAPLGARLCSPECAALRQLDLAHNCLSASSVELLLPLMRDVVAGLSKAQRIRRGLDSVPQHGVLHKLVLDGNPVGDAGAELLCDAAASDYTQLGELRLSRCGLGERGAAASGRLLENSSAIKILDISWNNLGRRGGQSLGEGLCNASSIQQLCVAWTGITDVGASHIAKAIKGNNTLQVLDLSGCSVSGDTSLVLLDSLSENSALTTLILRDNPVGVMAARKLLKALHQGALEMVDLLGCSFGGMGGSTVVWDPHDPDGVYDLDLDVPAHFQVATELAALAGTMGLRSWRSATLNGKPFRLNSTAKTHGGLPMRGRLHVEFLSCTPLVRENGALTEGELRHMWFTVADPEGKHTPSGPMVLDEEELDRPPGAAGTTKATPGQGSGTISAVSTPRNKAATGGAKNPAATAGGAAAAAAAKKKAGGGGGMASGGMELSSATELKGATDEWKLQLLEALVTDVYLTCAHLKHILRCFESRDARTEAVIQAFGVLLDTENFYAVLQELEPVSRQHVESRLGRIRMFFPENPTGRYTLMLSQLPHQCVAKQLLQQYTQQYDNKLTQHPNRVCFTTCIMDGVPTDVSDPHKLYLPQEGILELCFVDLRHAPPGSRSLNRSQFSTLISHLVNMETLDPVGLTRIIDHPALTAAVGALRRWDCWNHRHVLSSNVLYLWNAIHEIHKRDDPAGAAAAEVAAAEAAAALAAAAAAALAAAQPDAGGNTGGRSSALPRLARESHAPSAGGDQGTNTPPTVPSTPPATRASMLGSIENTTPDTPSTADRKNRRSTGYNLARDSAAGELDVPSPGRASVLGSNALTARSTGGGSVPPGGAAGRPRSGGVGRKLPAVPAGPITPPVYVRDMTHYVEAIRILSVRHYLTCWQLMQLLMLVPPTATDERVETVTAFWARVTDREAHWVDVMRSLTNEQQVRACQRLGYMNVYNENRPAMHYRLRMYKEDEHELAWQLYNKSLDSPMQCWRNLTIDDQPKRVNQGVNMWTVLRGNAADGTTPQTTLEFDFVWPDEDAMSTLAVRNIQRAWRLHKNPNGGGVPVALSSKVAPNQQPRFSNFSKKKTVAVTSKMNDPATRKK